jgi:hypothetical protein
VTSGQTPVLDPSEARALLDSIDVSTHAGLRESLRSAAPQRRPKFEHVQSFP